MVALGHEYMLLTLSSMLWPLSQPPGTFPLSRSLPILSSVLNSGHVWILLPS